VKRRPLLLAALGYLAALLAGFLLTRIGTITWDTVAHREHMLWLIGRWRGEDHRWLPYEELVWAGPLWEYVLAAFEGVFRFLRDPYCVRHAATFTLLPVTAVSVFLLLRKAGETRATAALAVALLLGNVRLVGHSILNVKDFPLACLYAVAALWMWSVLHEEGTAGLFSRPRRLVALAVVSVLPYLMQPPVLSHWLVLSALCAFAAIREASGVAPWPRWRSVVVPVATLPLLCWAVWPPLWDRGPAGLVASFSLFSKFPWRGTVRVLGTNYASNELPRWYGPFWIALSWEPMAFVVLAAGLVAFAYGVARTLLGTRTLATSILTDSLPVWVALFAAGPWAAVVALRPVLYDEDRHLLFAMPLLAVAAALGLRRLGERWKAGIAAIALVASLASTVAWGKYSYVYRSPLLRTAPEDFKGDYWGVSSGAMAQALYDHVPDGAWVAVAALPEPVTLEVERRERSRLVRAEPPKRFRLEHKGAPSGEFYVLATNRNGTNHRILEDIAAGRALELWRDPVPGGEAGAVLAKYTEPCPHCQLRVRLL
jgi:hypothetical protein